MNRLLTLLFFSAIIASCSPSTQELYEEASLRFDKDDFEGAIQILDSIIDRDKTNADYYHTRGSCKFNLKDFDGAIVDYSRAIELSGSKIDADLYYYRGDAYLMKSQHIKAIEDLSLATTLIPDYAEAFNLRGDAWMSFGNADSAFIDYTQAVKLNPNLAGAYYGLANYYSNLPDYSNAIEYYTRAIELKPRADYYYNRGLILYHENDFTKAIDDLTNALALDNLYLDAYVMRGSVRDEAGQGQEALTDFDEAIRIDPNYGFAYFNRGITRKSQGDKKGACEDFNKALELGYMEAIAKTGDCIF